MIERLENLGSERWSDIAAVCLPNATIVAAVHMVELNALLTFLSLAVTIGYTIWRWRRDSYMICAPCRDGRPPLVCPLPANKRPLWCPKTL
jgi:hypothetical protein